METPDDPALLPLPDLSAADPLLGAALAAGQLKHRSRRGWLQHGLPSSNCEQVAAHVFGVALLAMFLADSHYPRLDLLRVLRMALLHDLGEAHTGDLTPQDGVDPREKHARERAALVALLAGLPDSVQYLALWDEYERGETPEACLVRQADRLDMALQAIVYEHGGLLSADDFLASADRVMQWPELRACLAALDRLRPPAV